MLKSFILNILQIALFVLLNSLTIQGQNLSAVYVNSKLPLGRSGIAVVYDGDDTIYLFGGSTLAYQNDIFRFSITEDTLELVGKVPDSFSGGSAELHTNGDIFLFGGTKFDNEIWKFDMKTNRTVSVYTMPFDIDHPSTMKYNESSSKVIIFGGYRFSEDVRGFDMETYKSELLVELKHECYPCNAVRIGKNALVFLKTVTKVDLETFTSVDGTDALPFYGADMRSVTDGAYAYYIGGDYSTYTTGMIKVDPETLTHSFIPVNNLPISNTETYWNGPDYAYIPKLNRIYFFGGSVSVILGYKYFPDIWYIQLGSSESSTTKQMATTN